MERHAFTFRVLSAGAMACACIVLEARSQEPGCRTGAIAAADAYVLSNPIYSYFFGDLEQYVTSNAAHFRAEGDASRCIAALSGVFFRSAIQLYDPTDQTRRDELNAQLGKMGIPPGPQESTPSTQLYAASMRLARLARALPAAANGDFGPLRTPANDMERMEALAGMTFRLLLQDPDMQLIMSQVEPMIRELAALEHKVIQKQAAALAGQNEPSCNVTPATGECGLLEGFRALVTGNIAGAKQAFLRLRNSDPSNERWPLAEAIAWYKAGRLAEAEQANRRALEINPNSFTGHDNLAFVLFDLYRVSESLTHWEAALEIRKDDPDALAGKAIALQSLQRSAEAVELYRRAVRGNSNYLDCEVMHKQYLWSTTACEAAAPLIKQVRESVRTMRNA